jgi:microcystin-dependent protein
VALLPTLVIATSSTLGAAGEVVDRVTATPSTGTIPHATWQKCTWTVDTSTITNWGNGASLAFRFPGAQLDTTGKYVEVTEVQIQRGAVATNYLPPLHYLDLLPTGMLSCWPGALASIPAPWLPCHGQAVSRIGYGALFSVLGTTYGSGDGSTTFNLPDLRGRSVVGVDADTNRIQVTLANCTTTLDSAEVTVTSAENLRTGMGVSGDAFPVGTIILSIASLKLTLSNIATLTGPRTLRFNKLGSADANLVGAVTTGVASTKRDSKNFQDECNLTAGSKVVTVPNLDNLHIGMLVTGTGVPANTTLAAFKTATQIVLSQPADITGTSVLLTYQTIDSEGDPNVARELANDQPVIDNCTTAVGNVTIGVPYTAKIRKGMVVTGDGIPNGATVVSVAAATVTLSAAPTVAHSGSGTIPIKFSYANEVRYNEVRTGEPPYVHLHWIIKA